MNNEDRKYYHVRSENPDTSSELADLKLVNRHYRDIIRTVFDRQKAVYGAKTKGEGLPVSLGRYFYKKCYIPTTITQGTAKKGAPISVDDLIEEIVSHKQGTNANKSLFLLGDVGVGKTALVNAMLTRFLVPQIENNRVWFLRTDMEVKEQLHREQLFRKDLFLSHLSGKAVRVLRRYGQLWTDSPSEQRRGVERALSTIESLPLADPDLLPDPVYMRRREAFEKLLSAMETIGRRLVLFVDNMDYVCHIHDRALFYDDRNAAGTNTLAAVVDFINLFRRERDFGHLGLNVVFVTRIDSYNVLRATRNWSHQDEKPYAVTVHPPEWSRALKERVRLLRHGEDHLEEIHPPERAEEIDAIRNDFEDFVSVLERDWDASQPSSEVPLIKHLRELTNHGLRDLMTFFGEYCFLSHEKSLDRGDAIARFKHQYPVGLIAFMLNSKLMYRQSTAKFPNIYLARCLPGTSNPLGYTHPSCYWLKRLIVELLNKVSGLSGPEVVRVFAGKCGEGYKENIVRECLGSICDANVSNLVTVERRRSPGDLEGQLQVVSMKLTPRGKHMIGTGFIDRFFYLQLIVTDTDLPVPSVVANYFPAPDTMDYGYLVKPDTQYGEDAKAMIKTRARQVGIFAEVLEQALILEKRYCPKVFENLKQYDVTLPSVDGIRSRVREDLRRLDGVYAGALDLDRTYQLCNDLSPDLADNMRKAYAAAHSVPFDFPVALLDDR